LASSTLLNAVNTYNIAVIKSVRNKVRRAMHWYLEPKASNSTWGYAGHAFRRYQRPS